MNNYWIVLHNLHDFILTFLCVLVYICSARLPARAIENQSYVLAAAQFGRHNNKRESYGHSIGIDPWGEILEDAGGCDGRGTSKTVDQELTTPSVVICDIDNDRLRSIRERMPIRMHRDECKFSW